MAKKTPKKDKAPKPSKPVKEGGATTQDDNNPTPPPPPGPKKP